MPITGLQNLSFAERRRQYWDDNFESIVVVTVLIVTVCLGSFLNYRVSSWVFKEVRVAYFPETCFQRVSCEVLTVEHRFNSSMFFCTDIFRYTWKYFASPVVFVQEEYQKRKATDCLMELNVTAANARLQNGTNACHFVSDKCHPYSSYFNCATVLEANNVTVRSCHTLLNPTSTYDAISSLLLGAILVLIISLFPACCANLSSHLVQLYADRM